MGVRRVAVRRVGLILGVLLVGGNSIEQLSADRQARAPQIPRDWTTFDVCRLVPGDAVARAVAARLNETRPFYDKSFSRCTYLVTITATNKPAGYAVWMSPESDFEELKQHTESPLTPVTGLGDGAYMFQDKGDGLQDPCAEARRSDVRGHRRFGRRREEGRRRRRRTPLEEGATL